MKNLTIAKKLLALRQKRNETIDKVAKNVGISRSALAMYEAGRRVPRDAVKVNLANYYGVTVQELFFE